jgi:hypothetical protein
MSCEEDLQKILERYDTRVEGYLDRFSMSRVPGAHFLIGRIGGVSTRISRYYLHSALQLIEDGFCTPETPGGKRSYF